MKFANYLHDFIYRINHRHHIYINAYVNRSGRSSFSRNWGDDINYWFLREIVTCKFRLYNESPIAFRKCEENYLVIGSTISLLSKPSSIVWGAGCITDNEKLPAIPKKILAVRGPLTREYILKHNIECPEIYGDPALLLPFYYSPNNNKRYKVGLIQHVSETPINIKGCHNISMSDYKTWTDVIDEICACEVIASSSLHGLIVAEAYGISNAWVETKKLLGGHFKFHDFFQSIGADRPNPIDLKKIGTAEELSRLAIPAKAPAFDLSPLINVSPFELCLNLRKD